MRAVDQIVAEHEPEVAGMVEREGDEREAQGAQVLRHVPRGADLLQGFSQPFVGE